MQSPTAAASDMRLDIKILRLQQTFDGQPSCLRFTLRANMVDNVTREVLAWRKFDAMVAAESDDPYGELVAANRVVQSVTDSLASFCTEASAYWQPRCRSPQTHRPKRARAMKLRRFGSEM